MSDAIQIREIHIVTTIDHAIQTDAIYYFRNNLSRLTLRTLQYEESPKTLHEYVDMEHLMEQPLRHHLLCQGGCQKDS